MDGVIRDQRTIAPGNDPYPPNGYVIVPLTCLRQRCEVLPYAEVLPCALGSRLANMELRTIARTHGTRSAASCSANTPAACSLSGSVSGA